MPPARVEFRTVDDAAYICERPHRTIRTWAANGRVETMVDGRGRLLVDVIAASRLSEQAGRRNRTKAG